MREDPVARRNRSTTLGLWVLGGLAALIILLVAIDLLRPAPDSPLVEPEAAPVSMEQRVANEEVEAVRRERDRAHP